MEETLNKFFERYNITPQPITDTQYMRLLYLIVNCTSIVINTDPKRIILESVMVMRSPQIDDHVRYIIEGK